ncbi:MAG: hypothetical protein PHR22_04380 [Candidatus Omnitrophica bacterium]|nr:hypothetical protein [Candidatus Omnitrophota bacterium]
MTSTAKSRYFLRSGRKGQALIFAYVIVAVFIAISAALAVKAISEKNISLHNKRAAEALYMAEGGTENTIATFINAIASFQIQPNAARFPAAAGTYNNTNYTNAPFNGAPVTSYVLQRGTEYLVNEGKTTKKVWNYEIISRVVHPDTVGFPPDKQVVVILHQVIARKLTPATQFFIFYKDDLEILPGSNMSLGGKIHSNSNIYLDAESGKILTIDMPAGQTLGAGEWPDDYTFLHSSGNIYNERKDTGNPIAGDVDIRVDQQGASEKELMDGLDSNSPNWTTEALNRWGNGTTTHSTVEDASHGITQQAVPSVASIQPDGYYAQQAGQGGIVIQNDTVTLNGNPITCPADTVTNTTALVNNREGKTIKMTEVDLAKLAGRTATGNIIYQDPPKNTKPYPNNLPANGLIYATRNDAGVNQQPGIRLKNGSTIYKDIGLTVVSNDPIYIQGNYNTDNPKSTLVICDSVNLLSNNWNTNAQHPSDSSYTDFTYRTATDTTFNTSFIAGVDITTAGHYNGGLENYPRLSESWSNRTLSINGSFIELWNTADPASNPYGIAQGPWKYGGPNFYTAPGNRNWNYNNTTNVAPFTPNAVEAQRTIWWCEYTDGNHSW